MALAVEAMSTGQPEGTWYCAQPAGQRQEGRGISARGAVRGAGYAPPFAASEALYYGLEDAGPARHAPAGAVLRAPGLAAGPSFAPEFARAFPDYTDGFYSIGGLVVDQWPADPAATLNASFGPDGSGDWSASTSIYTASTASPAESTAYSPSAFTTSPVNTTHGSPNPVCGTPAYLPNSLAAPQIDPLALVYPDLLPSFPYVASAEVASEARVPDIFVEDEGQEGRGAKRVGKRVS